MSLARLRALRWPAAIESVEEDELETSSEGPFQRGIALGFLAMLPMLAVYEWALSQAQSGGYRNTSEMVLFRFLLPFGDNAQWIRQTILVVLGAIALGHCLRRHWDLMPRVARVMVEGLLGALVLGPILVGLTHAIGLNSQVLQLAGVPRSAPDLSSAALVLGAGAYEELVFRVGLYSLCYLAFLQVGRFLGLAERPARWVADGSAIVGQALAFAAFHLALFTAWLGPGGESFELSIFAYRALAGGLLGAIFRLRGPGVAAWTHGLFNVALLLGAGPDVFL